MKKLILICGPAGIGKSTFSKGYIHDHPEEKVFVLAADEFRKQLYGGYDKFPPNKNMMYVYECMCDHANKLIKENDSVTILLDTTMLYDERRLYFVRNIKGVDFRSLTLLKLNDYSKCLERNRRREKAKWVPEDVILDMVASYKDPDEETKAHFNEVKEIYVD